MADARNTKQSRIFYCTSFRHVDQLRQCNARGKTSTRSNAPAWCSSGRACDPNQTVVFLCLSHDSPLDQRRHYIWTLLTIFPLCLSFSWGSSFPLTRKLATDQRVTFQWTKTCKNDVHRRVQHVWHWHDLFRLKLRSRSSARMAVFKSWNNLFSFLSRRSKLL